MSQRNICKQIADSQITGRQIRHKQVNVSQFNFVCIIYNFFAHQKKNFIIDLNFPKLVFLTELNSLCNSFDIYHSLLWNFWFQLFISSPSFPKKKNCGKYLILFHLHYMVALKKMLNKKQYKEHHNQQVYINVFGT